MTIPEIEKYTKKVIPKLEELLQDDTLPKEERLQNYKLYKECLRFISPYDFASYNKYLEFNEDKTEDNKGFYHKRKNHLSELFTALNDMEIYDKYNVLLVSMPPRVGKTVTNLRFVTWIMGRKPLRTQLAISYSDAVTKMFYIGVMSILLSPEFGEVFPNSKVVGQNAKDENIWLNKMGQYPTISFIPIEGSMTGRGQGTDYIFYDDLVSGSEQALSRRRMDTLWDFYSTNSIQRKLKGCKEIHIATRWSVHDPMSRIERMREGDPRFKSIKLPCYDENGESLFDFRGGFDTNYYNEIQMVMEELAFRALYQCEPIEREGLLYHVDDLQYYFELPAERPDTIVAICDSKNMGKDYVCAPVGYVYGDLVYIESVVYNNGLPEITRPLVAKQFFEHKVVRADIELNNGGNYYAEDVDNLIHELGGKTSIRMFFSGNNKQTKIITYSDFVKKHFVFKDSSKYTSNSEYSKFMQALISWTQIGNNKNDDAPDAIAMLAQLIQELEGNAIKILDRKALRL